MENFFDLDFEKLDENVQPTSLETTNIISRSDNNIPSPTLLEILETENNVDENNVDELKDNCLEENNNTFLQQEENYSNNHPLSDQVVEDDIAFFIPYKYSIINYENSFDLLIFSRSNNGSQKKTNIFNTEDSFVLLCDEEESAKSKIYTNILVKNYQNIFMTENVKYFFEEDSQKGYFIISPYKNIPLSFLKENENKIIKIDRSIYNVNYFILNNRNFFDILDLDNNDIRMNTEELMKFNLLEDSPFLFKDSFSDICNNINFASFKTVIWSVINNDTLIFIFYDSSFKNNQSIEPYSEIFIWTSNFNLNEFFSKENQKNEMLEFLNKKIGIKKLHIKLVEDFRNNNNNDILTETETEIFSKYILEEFIEFLKVNVDICINYGEKDINFISKKIFNTISKNIKNIQNIDIYEFFSTLHSYYDDHSLYSICSNLDLPEKFSNIENENIIKNIIDIISIETNSNNDYCENYLNDLININTTNNSYGFMKNNIQTYLKIICSRIILISKLWVCYSKNFFEISQLSNTNFNDVTTNVEEIIKGMLIKKIGTKKTAEMGFLKTPTIVSKMNKNFYLNYVEVFNSTPFYLELIKNSLNEMNIVKKNNITPYEIVDLFDTNESLKFYYWIFFKFLDLYNIFTMKKIIPTMLIKEKEKDLFSKDFFIGLYKGMFYLNRFEQNNDLYIKVKKILFENKMNFWNFIFVMKENNNWIGVKFVNNYNDNLFEDGKSDSDESISNEDKKTNKQIKYLFSYFGENVICKSPFKAIKNIVEYYFVFFFTQKNILNIVDNNLFEYNIEINESNTKMLFPINNNTISFFEDDTIENFQMENKNNSSSDYYSDKKFIVWYDKDLKLTLISNKMNKKVYNDLIKIYLKRNIDINFKNYIDSKIKGKLNQSKNTTFPKGNKIIENTSNNTDKNESSLSDKTPSFNNDLKNIYNIKTPEKLQKFKTNS